jgi:putative transposase
VEVDEHFLIVCRYVERNPLRAGLVARAEAWRWGSLGRGRSGAPAAKFDLTDWPVTRPDDWVKRVNRPQTAAELEALRRSVQRGQPYGGAAWVERVAQALGLDSTLRPRGRPRKQPGPDQ